MIGKEIAHYKILDRLGGGGMGMVYKAEDLRLGRVVALKFLNPELLANDSLRRRFLHEARAASLIDHPNVCHVYEVDEADDGRAFMAMSYCEGRSLREVIRAGPVAPREAFSIAFGIAQGLWAAHRRNIVHRDIKPANVSLTDDGFVRIVDFGLALLIGDSRVTTSGVTVGTVAYMSPEQTSGSKVSANTDIWSLGVTLYELLTGHLPFRGDVNAALVYSIVHEPHTPLPGSIPRPCARIVDRCLEKDPAKRYQTIEELLEDMVKVAQEMGWESSMASATIAPILHEKRRRELARRLVVSVAALAVLAGGIYAWREFQRHSMYSTKVRLAVLPFDNLLGAENEAAVDGLSDHVARVTRWVARGHASMWSVAYSDVVDAELARPADAMGAFGVNRIITGDVQRVGNSPRLRLRLADARSGRVIHETSLPLDIDASTTLVDSLPLVIGDWFDIDADAMPRGTPWHIRNAVAIRPYLEGLSLQRRGGKDPALAERAVTVLETSASRDTSFACAAVAAGNAELTRFRQTHAPELLRSALRHGRSARRQAPALTDASILLGDVFRVSEDPDSAEACYQFAAQEDPNGITPRGRMGSLYASQDRIQESEREYRHAIETNHDNWIAHRYLGVFYYLQHRPDDAENAWLEANKLAPHDVLTLSNLGVVHYDRGEWRDAQRMFLQAFKIHPNCESCNNVASTLFLDGKYKQAAAYFEMALTPEYCDSTGHLPWGNLASALYWIDDQRPRALQLYRHAILLAEKDLAATPDSPKLIGKLVDYYAMTGDSTRALEMIERAKPYLEKDDDMMYKVGSACEKIGRRSAAMKHLTNAVRHGYALPLIQADPILKDLVANPVFQEMTRTEAVADGASATKNSN